MSLEKIDFVVSFKEPKAHYVEVEMTLVGLSTGPVDLKMPAWTPGSYLIREFARHVEQLTVSDEHHRSIDVEKTEKNTWRVINPSNTTIVRYRVYGFERSVRTNFIDESHAFLSSAATFLYVHQHIHLPATVKVVLPDNWAKISTGLIPFPDQKNTYSAENFDILYDSPLEIGNQDTWTFDAAGIPHEFAMVGTAEYDKERLSEDIRKIVDVETAIWGTNPNDYYLFITHNHQNAHGGLEHLNSTVLATSRDNYRSTSGYTNFLSLIAHEYFHLWHVKRLRPDALGPFDYERENYTRLLWIFEGFTAYYDNLIIRRCGFFNEGEYLAALATDFNAVLNRPGHQVQSAAQASFDAWIKHYRPDENSPNTSISYYNKGAMLAAILDIYILAMTDGRKRLDQVLQAAYNQYYIIENRGVTETEFQEVAEQVAGVSLQAIFTAAHDTEELDYNAYFNLVGYQLVDDSAGNTAPNIGIKCISQDGRLIVKSVERDSAAWQDGLNVDDEIIAFNRLRVDPDGRELDALLKRRQIGDHIEFLISRDGLTTEIPVRLKPNRKSSYSIERNPDATAVEKRLGQLWLSLNETN